MNMAWYARDEALPIKTVEQLREYIRSLNYSNWRPSNFVIHNTASPTLYQWWHSVPPEQRLENLKSYYQNDMGWSSGPHVFVDGETWWIFCDFNVKGVHSPSWNGTMLGFEMVGDYDSESDESGMGLKVKEMGVALSGEVCEYFGWEPDNLKFHKEDPATDHDCPGQNLVKSEWIDDTLEYMGSGGGDTDKPVVPHQGTIANLGAGDRLNIRAGASSSSAVIGQADNDDQVMVIGEAYNGSTRWLRIQIGTEVGPNIAVFGWVSGDYVDVEGELPPLDTMRTDITATEFGGGGDDQDSAYPDIDWIDDSSKGVALPYKWKDTPRPRVYVKGPKGEVITDIIDLGPWNTHDPAYCLDGKRPLSEYQYENEVPAQNGMVPSNDAGIDLTPPVAKAVGISGKGKVSWRFAGDQEEIKKTASKNAKKRHA
jgi:hypothetical protein